MAISSGTLAQDRVGITECDTMIELSEKLDACLNGSVSAEQREISAQARRNYRAMAANLQTRDTVRDQCARMQQTVEQMLSARGCRP